MARFVPDVNTSRWVIIAPTRISRPKQDDTDIVARKKQEESFEVRDGYAHADSCPFCKGNESRTPPEIYRWGRNEPSDPNWLVRVVPNKYPITDIHEVIVHSPDHVKDLADFDNRQVQIILTVFRERYNALKGKGQVIIFNNVGIDAGASLRHPHSQVVVLPNQINIDVLEIEPVANIIEEREEFVVWAPEFSQWPWEVWVALRDCCLPDEPGESRNGRVFGAISDDQIVVLAGILQESIRRLLAIFPQLSYNFYIYPKERWYLRIIPRVVHRAGFELGTGLQVNVVDPLTVVEELKKNGNR